MLALLAPLYRLGVLGRALADADAVPRHRRREPDLPLGVRRHGLARPGGDLRDRRLRASATPRRTATRRGSTWAGTPGGASCSGSRSRSAVGLLFGALASRSVGIYFLMITLTYSVIANLTFGQVTDVSGFGGISGIPTPHVIGTADAHHGHGSTTSRSSSRSPSTCLLRYIARTPFGLALQGVRDDPVRMASLGYNVEPPPDARVRVRLLRRGDRRRALRLVERPHRPGLDRSRRDDRRARDRRRRRPLPPRRRLGRRARSSSIVNNYSQQIGFIGPRFHTLIGAIFLVIVLVSPGGLIGLWERARSRSSPGRRGPP